MSQSHQNANSLSPARRSVLILAMMVLYAIFTLVLLLIVNRSISWNPVQLEIGILVIASITLVALTAGLIRGFSVQAQRDSGERQRLAETLQRNEQRFKVLYERAGLGYQSLTEVGCLEDVNLAWLQMMGYERDQVVGRWFGDFLTPNSQAAFWDSFSRFKTAGEMNNCMLEVVRGDGIGLLVSFDGWISYDEYGRFRQAHCVLTDVTERELVEQALRAERDRAQQYLDIAGVMLVVLNTDQTIAHINLKGCETLGYKTQQLIGQNWFDFCVPARTHGEARQLFEALLSGDIQGDEYFEHPVLTQTGDERLIAWHITVLTNASGHITGLLGSGDDITERRQMEESLHKARDGLELRVQERTSALSRANEQLQQEIIERKRVEAAEKEQRVLAEALRDTASALNSTLNFEEVLDQILANLERVVQHGTGNIMLVEDDCVRIVRWRGYDSYVRDEVLQSVRLSISGPSHLRWMAETGQPLIIPDVDQYPLWARLESSAWARSYVGAPIRTGEQVIGFINLDSAEPGYFKSIHAEGLRAFVDQAAIAIENARLYSRAQELAAMEERNRIAHDLHDAVSQTLWSVCLITDGLPGVWDKDPKEGRQTLETLHLMTRGALAEMRTLLLELRPAALAEVELGELVRQLTQAFSGRTGIPVMLTIKGRRMLPPEVQATLYRITQEALNNVARHAAASQVDVSLLREPGRVELRILDNGAGFALDSIAPGHLGIGFMCERAEAIGARLKIDSRPGYGTTVEIVWIESKRL